MVAKVNECARVLRMHGEVLPLRHASRELVRELGFLQEREPASGLSHSHCHALMEVEARPGLTQGELAKVLRLDKSRTSRIVAELEARGWTRADADAADKRVRRLRLTARGEEKVARVHESASQRVDAALAMLDEDGRGTVLRGMQLYAQALERSRRRGEYATRPARSADRAAIARLIRTVMPEFGAEGPGFAIVDPEVDDMPRAYAGPRSAYFVVVRGDAVVGGGGFAPLVGGDEGTCELRKMYFLPELRGLGLGRELLERCIEGARASGFTRMYLETLTAMSAARRLYERFGFEKLDAPLGATGHFGCNSFYARSLREGGARASSAGAQATQPSRRSSRRG